MLLIENWTSLSNALHRKSNNRPSRLKQGKALKQFARTAKKSALFPLNQAVIVPVHRQDCFSRRKVIRLSGMKIEEKPAKRLCPFQQKRQSAPKKP